MSELSFFEDPKMLEHMTYMRDLVKKYEKIDENNVNIYELALNGNNILLRMKEMLVKLDDFIIKVDGELEKDNNTSNNINKEFFLLNHQLKENKKQLIYVRKELDILLELYNKGYKAMYDTKNNYKEVLYKILKLKKN